jgi:hypothetical protein
MLYGAKSLAADLVKPMIAAFDATYAGIVGVPRVAAMLAVFTMEYPLPPVSIMRFATAFITLNDPTTLMSITCRNVYNIPLPTGTKQNCTTETQCMPGLPERRP